MGKDHGYKKFLRFIICMMLLFSSCSNEKPKVHNRLLNKDTVYVRAKLVTDTNSKTTYINCNFMNSSYDTLIFLADPFIIESNILKEDIPFVYAGTNLASPNIIYVYKKQNKISFSREGMYRPYFNELPKINIVLPYDSILIRISIPEIITNRVSPEDLNFFGTLVYGIKRKANDLSGYIDSNMRKTYYEKIIFDPSMICNPVWSDEFINMYSDDKSKDTTVSKFLWWIFPEKVFFKNEYIHSEPMANQ